MSFRVKMDMEKSERNKKITIVLFICIVGLIIMSILFVFWGWSNQHKRLYNNKMVKSMNNGVILNTFPVDLDKLFWFDNKTMQNYKLNLIGNGSYVWMLTPWGGHFVSLHIEGVDHWYCFTPYRPLEVRAPHSGYLGDLTISNGTIRYVNGTKVLSDTKITIYIGGLSFVGLGHVCLLKSLYDKIKANRFYRFEEGEVIGYTRPSNGTVKMSDSPQVDFWYYILDESVCPYNYLSPELKEKVSTLFNIEYQKAKLAGVFPEANICNKLEVDIEGTIWGSWMYFNGPYNNYITGSDAADEYEGGK